VLELMLLLQLLQTHNCLHRLKHKLRLRHKHRQRHKLLHKQQGGQGVRQTFKLLHQLMLIKLLLSLPPQTHFYLQTSHSIK
jgi:hypothetical protein